MLAEDWIHGPDRSDAGIFIVVKTIRDLQAADWPQVAEIYRQGMTTGRATFETRVPEWADWNAGCLPFARLVAEAGDRVCGWVVLKPTSKREAYRGVAEMSIYVHEDYRQRGVGDALLDVLLPTSEHHGIWSVQASVFPENSASIRLLGRKGFRRIGYRERVARLHGAWKDNVLFERRSERADFT